MKLIEELKKRLQPKSLAERERLKKLAVYTVMSLSCIVCLWLIFAPSGDGEAEAGKANMELPDQTSNGLPENKIAAYEQDEMQRDKQRQDSTLQATQQRLDSTAVVEAETVPDAVQSSADAYQNAVASLNDFYVPEPSDQSTEVAALQERIAELEAQQSAPRAPTEMELMQESYRMASQLMGNGQIAPPAAPESKEKRNVLPVQNVAHNVVSTLSAQTNERGFNTSVGTKKALGRNTIAAVVASDQSITNGQAVKLRTVEPMWVGNRFIPRNTTIVGMARLNGERLGVEITSVEVSGSIYEVELTVYDSDGQEGINIPNCLESDALKEIGANMGSTMGSSINLTTDVGAQLASDVGKGLINGVSQYLTKKIRTVKVHLKAGYRVMLYQPENN